MSLERVHEILDALAKNLHQSGHDVDVGLIKEKNERSGTRGPNSEAFAKFIISQIPEVTEIIEVHEHIENLDCDLQVHFANTLPVNVQVKSSDYGVFVFMEKMKEQKIKTKNKPRWVIVNLENSFEEIQKNFIDQVNLLDKNL